MLFGPLFIAAMAVLAIGSLGYWIYIAVTEKEVPEELEEVMNGCGILGAIFFGLILIFTVVAILLGLHLGKF